MKKPKGTNGDFVDASSDKLTDLVSTSGESHDNRAYEAARKRAEARGEKEVSPEFYEALAQEFNERHDPKRIRPGRVPPAKK